MPASSTYSRPPNSRVSFWGEPSATVPSAVVAPGQAAVGDLGAGAGRGVEGRDAAAAGPQPLGQRALRDQLDLELAAEVLALELLVLADVGAGRAADALGVEQHAQAPAVDAAVVRHGLQVGRALLEQRGDQVVRDAVEAEPADRQRRAARDVGDRLRTGSDDFVHTSQPSATAGWVRPARLRLAGSGRRGDRAGDPEFVVHELPGQCNPGRLRRLRRARGAGHLRGRAAAVVRHRAAAARRVRADRERRDRNRHLAAAAQRDPAARSTSTSPASCTR